MKSNTKMPPPVNCRLKGHFRYNDRVVVIIGVGMSVTIMIGFICSTSPSRTDLTDGSHVGVDNVTRVVVWGDVHFNDLADSTDDTHERGFDVEDPCLLRLEEAELLADREIAKKWFKNERFAAMAYIIADALAEALRLQKVPGAL